MPQGDFIPFFFAPTLMKPELEIRIKPLESYISEEEKKREKKKK